MADFTKAEWRRDGSSVVIPVWGESHVSSCYAGTDANAHLISAAPDMYEAIKCVLSWIGTHDTHNPNETSIAWNKMIGELNDALKKAKGET